MDEETLQHLEALKQINKALVGGLQMAILIMDKWDELGPERRESLITKLKDLIATSNKTYGIEPTKH